MKIYVSSYRIPSVEAFTGFVENEASQTSIGLILNAQDYKSKQDRAAKKDELVSYFTNRGFSVEEIDLGQYDEGSELKQAMKQHDVVWFNVVYAAVGAFGGLLYDRVEKTSLRSIHNVSALLWC